MKDEYDFSAMKSRKNPYATKLKKPVSRLPGPRAIPDNDEAVQPNNEKTVDWSALKPGKTVRPNRVIEE